MKKLLLFLTISLTLINFPAFSLPGSSYSRLSSWVKSHPFLSAEPDSYGDAEGLMEACRNTDEGKRVCWIADFTKNDVAYREELTLSSNTANTDLEDIWSRENQSALKVLNLIYGDAISNDFKNSSFILQIDQYILTSDSYLNWVVRQYGSCCRGDFLIPQSFVNQNVNGNQFFSNGVLKFYKGKTLAYQASNKGIMLMTHQQMWKTIDVLQKNKKMYDFYLKKFAPANISL